jgi:hypothetical protein
MSEREEILYIEHTLKNIFKKDIIRRYDITISNQLLDRWKQLTKYKIVNPVDYYIDILDETPKHKK